MAFVRPHLLVDLFKGYIIKCTALSGKRDNQSDASVENRRIHTVNFGCQASSLTSCCLPPLSLPPFFSQSLSLSVCRIIDSNFHYFRPPPAQKSRSAAGCRCRAAFCCCGHSLTHSHCHIILSSFFFFFFFGNDRPRPVASPVSSLVLAS